MKNSIIGLRELRERVDAFISQVERGKSFIVMKRSKPVFKISPPDEEDEAWEAVVDFTKFYKDGIPTRQLLKKLQSLHGKS